MEKYTYKDYLLYETITKRPMQLREPSVPYKLENKTQKRDKIFKDILDNKKEAVNFINRYLKPEPKLKEEEIEKYNRKFVIPELENRESDIIYKIKEKQIFFLIEIQTKVDYSMPVRMLEYSTEIIRSATSKERLKIKGETIANVYPIVLYTGKTKWTAEKTIIERQERLKGIPNMLVNRYNLVDINDYTEEELMKENSILSKAMLLEKEEKPEKIMEILRKIIAKNLNADDIYFLNMIVKYLLIEKIGQKNTKEIFNRIKNQGGDSMFIDRLAEYFDEREAKALQLGEKRGKEIGEKRGEKNGIRKVIIEMIKNQMDDKQIIKITKIKNDELQEIKNSI